MFPIFYMFSIYISSNILHVDASVQINAIAPAVERTAMVDALPAQQARVHVGYACRCELVLAPSLPSSSHIYMYMCMCIYDLCVFCVFLGRSLSLVHIYLSGVVTHMYMTRSHT